MKKKINNFEKILRPKVERKENKANPLTLLPFNEM